VQTVVEVPVAAVTASAYTIPTDEPESDGTLEWDATTIVVVEAQAGDHSGLGYTYGHAAAARVVEETLAPLVEGTDATAPAALWERLGAALRNAGRPGIGMTAVSGVDIALWDLKARLLGVSLASLLGVAGDPLPVYGSGGFTSYSLDRLGEQLGGWVDEGIPRVKLKIGREPERDPARLDVAREAVGAETELYVDANGAFTVEQALDWAGRLALQWGVTWFEEPVSSADLEGLALVRDRAPAGLEVAAGEYGYVLRDFVNLVGAVDCLQADVTRCGGITGLIAVGGLAAAHGLDLSAHTAPAVSAHAFAAVSGVRHLEWFHDHVRVERLLFDGTLEPQGGALRPDLTRPGLGLELRRRDAERWRVA
jgi:L-alanine-DL-glutamate epimerase-like enolase superfamily enzyme